MFKKRNVNKELSQLDKNHASGTFLGRPATSGIDLRKDIEEMQSLISEKKQKQPSCNPQDENKLHEEDKPEYLIFKTKKINKFTSHILKNLPIKIHQQQENIPQASKAKVSPQISTPKQQNLKQKSHVPKSYSNKDLIRPIMSNYGLLDQSHFQSTQNYNQAKQLDKQKDHHSASMDFYVKKKMEEITKNTNLQPNTTDIKRNRQPQAWQEVLQIQKQYLTQEQKIKEYSVEEIKKKLQKLAQDTIKSEIEKRNFYLKDLLQNEHERMQYASKKQLKVIKQQKERIERELNSKYRDSGRRHFVQSIKNSVL